MSGAKFLPKVIEYDRYQPRILRRHIYLYKKELLKKLKEGLTLYKKEKKL